MSKQGVRVSKILLDMIRAEAKTMDIGVEALLSQLILNGFELIKKGHLAYMSMPKPAISPEQEAAMERENAETIKRMEYYASKGTIALDAEWNKAEAKGWGDVIKRHRQRLFKAAKAVDDAAREAEDNGIPI